MADRYAVIGHPVAHSKSPGIHAEFARQTGQSMVYERIEAPLEGFREAVEAFRAAGGRGLNVTLPFKEQAYALAQARTPRAEAARAVNTLIFNDEIGGDNTDGVGLVRDLERNLGFRLRGARVLLLGAGGAAQGVALPLLDAGAAELVIANRTVERARELAARLPSGRACTYEALAGCEFDLAVNATSAGLGGASLPLPPGILRSGMLAYDMVYGRDTGFLSAARAAGAATSDGLGMLVEQAAESFYIWRGVHPETGGVLEALRTT